MSLQATPRANRVHIAVFGLRNSGKSSLINALTGQNIAIVSDVPGTTTDPVEALLRCGPNAAKYTIIAGKVVVDDGRLVSPDVEDRLTRHEAVSRRLQGLALS